MKHNKYSAFSLIELSIVILIIGILIGGISQGLRLYNKFKISVAQSLTKSSPVLGIKDLALWYETSLDSSFEDSDRVNGGSVYTWHDSNSQKQFRKDASNGGATVYPNTCATCPTYQENVINGLPAVRFDGVNDYMPFDGSILNLVNYTIFAVGSPNGPIGNFAFFIGGNSGDINNHNICIGWRNSNLIYFWDYVGSGEAVSYSFFIPNSGDVSPKILTARFDQGVGKTLWTNGGTSPGTSNTGSTGDPVAKSPVVDYSGSSLARFVGNYAKINIAELIIYQRALTTEERQVVESYLGKKYNIKINP